MRLARLPEHIVDFIEKEVNPGAERRDADVVPIPRHLLEKAAAIGMLAPGLPADLGGDAYSQTEWTRFLQEVSFVSKDPALPLWISQQTAWVRSLKKARPETRDKYLDRVVRGEVFCCLAYTDRGDPFSFKTRAYERGDGSWVLSGFKPIVTGGVAGDLFVVYAGANDSKDLVVLLVEANDPGVEVQPVTGLSLRSCGQSAITFREVVLGPERVLAASDGLSHAQAHLNHHRSELSAFLVGWARGAVAQALEVLGGKVRYGRPLTDYPAVQATLGKIFSALRTSQAILESSTQRMDSGEANAFWDPLISCAKHAIASACADIGRWLLELMGTEGYLSEFDIERRIRGLLTGIPVAGAQGVLEIDLGSWLVSDYLRTGIC